MGLHTAGPCPAPPFIQPPSCGYHQSRSVLMSRLSRRLGVLVRVVRGLAGRLGGLGGLGGSGCRRVSGEGAASESGLVSKSLVSRARFTQIAGASSGGTWWCTHPLFWSMRSRVAWLSVRVITVRSGLPAAHLRITRFPRGRGHVPEDVAFCNSLRGSNTCTSQHRNPSIQVTYVCRLEKLRIGGLLIQPYLCQHIFSPSLMLVYDVFLWMVAVTRFKFSQRILF